MKILIGLLFWVCVSVQLGAINPDKAKPAASPKSMRNNSALGPQGVVSDSVVKFLNSRKTGKDLMLEKKKRDAAKAASMAADPLKKTGPAEKPADLSTNSKAARQGSRTVPPPPVSRAALPQIRQEIQKILELNKQIKAVQGGTAVQFQRVQEQARIHQKILNQIEASSGGQAELSTSKVPSKEALLAQEKLRIIHEETQRNRKLLEAGGGDGLNAASGAASSMEFKKPAEVSASAPAIAQKSSNP